MNNMQFLCGIFIIPPAKENFNALVRQVKLPLKPTGGIEASGRRPYDIRGIIFTLL